MITREQAVDVASNQWHAAPLSIVETFQTIIALYDKYDDLRNGTQALAHRWDARSQGAARDVTEYNVMTTFRECAEQLQALIPGGDQGQDPEDDE